jgi:hypothetical protein
MSHLLLHEAEEWFSDIAVNPHELKENDRVYCHGSNWRVVQVINFDCEGCGLNHKAVVMAYRNYQYQTWAINDDDSNKYFWLCVVPLKHKNEYRQRFRRLTELQKQAFRERHGK